MTASVVGGEVDRDGLMESVGMESLLGWGRDGVLGVEMGRE